MSPRSTSLSSFVQNHRFSLLNLIQRNFLIMLPVLLSVITRALVTSDNCFGGVETFEKIAGMNFEPNTVPMAGVLLQQDNVALTRDCINLCRQQQRCTTFFLDYIQFRCSAYVESSRRHRDHLQTSKSANLFEKICLKGISRQEFDHVCGNERLWAFERVKDTFLDGFVEKELTNMVDREECAKACLIESAFICRSAEFDEVKRICRLSKENRRTQPQAFVYVKNSQKDYIENQCAPAGPASCVYTTKTNTNVFSMDSLQFATSSEDCQLQCDRETSFNCRAYGFINNRCMLSGDDEKTIGKHPLISMKGAMYGERTCVAELCTNGIFTYEKITGHVLRSAITSPVELPEYTSLGVTAWCRESCDMAQLNCPAFTVNYKNSRCERLDRNTQGRTSDLTLADGESYFEKICLRVPQIMSQCQDKFWAFERVLGYELAPILYVKTLNFVQSRRDCQEYCLQEREFPCRSALYNDETTECKLSPEDRRTSPGHYYRSRSMKINYLENQCVRIHSSCPYQRTENAYPTYTDVVETNSIYSNEACEKLCNDNRYFLCRSYAYYSSNSQCFLSGDDSVSAGLSSHIQHRSNIMYYERQCSKLNTFNANQSMDSQSLPHGSNGQPGLIDSMTTDEYPIPLTPTNDFFKDRIGESSTPPSSSIHGISGFGPGGSGGPATTPDIDLSNVNKEVVIINGTVGGIITTKITRFPESLLPTLSPPVITSPKPIYPSDILSPHNGVQTGTGSGNRPNDQLSPDNGNANDDNRFNMNYPSNKKCAPNARFLFEKVTSFEPIGGHLTLLYTDLQNPGIVTECAKRCEHSALCRAFVVDYYHQTCHGLFENSSVGLLDLRLSMGKDYFEGFCVPNYVHCDKFWPFDRIIDQAVIGSRPEEIVRFVSRAECRNRCLEEKKFRCSSVSYNSFTHECHLYSEERDSGSLNLQFTKGIDFMENQCVIDVKSCRYHAIERDISIVSVTKSVRGTSTFHCEQACDYEKEFNCRSYTYLDNPDGSIAPGGNLCLLSADNRATSHQGSIQFRPRALYAEKDCFFRRNPTIPINSNINLNNNDNNGNRLAYLPPSSTSISGNHHQNIDHGHSHNHPPPTVVGGPNFINSEQEEGLTARRIDQSTNNHLNNNKPIITQQMLDRINSPESRNNPLHPATFNNMVQLQHIPHRCQPDEYSFEKTFGYDLRYAQRERAPISARIGLANFCKDECLRRGDRCAAFTIEYGSNSNAQQQNCYFLTEAAMENRNQLNKLMGTSYNEKICLREKTCDSTWAFERMIGYTMDSAVIAPDREINSIMFRTACQDLCLLEKNFSCHSLTYDYGRRICRLYKNTRRSMPQAFQKTNDHVDYFENKCIKELSTCQYRDYKDRYFNYVDKVSIATSLIDCQRQCDSEISFHCKSVNYDLVTKECTLSSEDSTSIQNVHNDKDIDNNNNNGNGNELNKKTIPMDQSIIAPHKRGSIFSEKGNCEQVSVQCNQQDMMLTLNFDSPFHGRVYTKNNPSQCFVTGNGQLKLQFAIPLNSRCGTYQESTSSYVNEVIVQQHSVIMTDNDRTIRVLCSFEISDQTITLANGEQQQQQQKSVPLTGIDVSSNYGRSFTDRKSTATVVTNTAAPPSIIMRILDHTGQDAQVVSLGDDLTLRIELRGERNSPFAIFARNLYARSSNGESLFLIDNNGCPIDSTIFPALQLDPNDQRSLYSKFKAFRFPSTGVVNFEVQIRFCQDYCEPIKCTQLNGHVDSYGRRRRRRRRSITINNFQELLIGNSSGNVDLDHLINKSHNSSDQHQQPQQIYSLDGMDIWSFENSSTSITSTHINNNGSSLFRNNDANQNPSSTNNDNNTNDRKLVRNINMNNNDKSFERTRSNKTGFIYPTNNYRYFRNNVSYDGNSDHNNNHSHTLSTSNNDKKHNIDHDVDYNENNVSNFMESNPTNNKFKRHPSNDIGNKIVRKNMIQNGNTFTLDSTMTNSHHKHNPTNAALPLPTSATEVPLSLAIMVDNDDADDPDDNKTDNNGNILNEFDDQTSLSLDTNDHTTLNHHHNNEDHQHLHHYHHQPDHQKQFTNNNLGVARRLETRHNLRKVLNDKTKGKNLHLMCSEHCTNTGIIIFITTLIVTIVHLTLGASVYLYLTKLKQFKKQQRQLFYNNQQQHNYHHSGMPFSPLNYQIPPIGTMESLSPISTLDDVDGIGGEDTLTRNAVLSVEDDVEDNDADGYNIDDKNKSVQQKPLSWFGANAETQQQEQKQNFGSIRSTFNRENIFFGAKEQRFFGLNSYSFPNSMNANHNHDSNGQSK